MQQGKVVVAGHSGVGKTCIIQRYCNGTYSLESTATVNAAFFRKEYQVQGKDVALSIWDTAGQERYQAISPVYFRGAQFALIVFDITNPQTFEAAKTWATSVSERSQVKTTKFLVGNKCDMVNQRQITKQQAEELATELGMRYWEVSAKANTGIDELFQEVGKQYASIYCDVDLPVVIKKVNTKGGCC